MPQKGNIPKETKIQLAGYEMLEKLVNKSGNSGRVYVPVEWVGKKIKIILIEK
jgi:putative transposon-encoded protein|tara:strand:- start:340 stop:498 length:159 start_codon:yes stop_codon:yes gene_type:complete